jgi:hypothetical protein
MVPSRCAMCHLQQLHVCLHVIVVSGEITTLVVLDYETVPNYHLRIRATDMGSPTLFSKLTMAELSAIHSTLL